MTDETLIQELQNVIVGLRKEARFAMTEDNIDDDPNFVPWESRVADTVEQAAAALEAAQQHANEDAEDYANEKQALRHRLEAAQQHEQAIRALIVEWREQAHDEVIERMPSWVGAESQLRACADQLEAILLGEAPQTTSQEP